MIWFIPKWPSLSSGQIDFALLFWYIVAYLKGDVIKNAVMKFPEDGLKKIPEEFII